jgi:phosphotransferase system enzyme I (PtsI)
MEIIRKGIPVWNGYAIGEALVLDTESYRIPQRTVPPEQTDGEIARLEQALAAARKELETQHAKITKKASGVAEILQAHMRLLSDPTFREDSIAAIRRSRFSSEYAVTRTLGRKIKALQDSGSSYAQSFSRDLAEIEKLILRHLLGEKREDISHLTKKVLVVAHDLSPAQTLALDRTKVLGLITEVGGRTSHTAIVAASLGIPAVVGVQDICTSVGGADTVILDGTTGTIIINPGEATLKRYQAMERNFVLLEKRLERELRDLPAETRDGRRVEVLANIEMPDEVQTAVEHGAEGIGLYRTEFLYLRNDFNPTEALHVEAYRRALQLVGGRKLVIRTLDLGADKMPVDGMPKESNPFLGTRAVRLCFERLDIFRTQLRAILKVSALGPIHIMVPMVATIDEIVKVREVIEEVRRELRHEGESIPDRVSLGIMVEVPSAALTADLFADHVDFFSIGTNDLIGYSLAVDRLNERLASLYQPSHPAILRMIAHVIDVGIKRGKPVSVCGEMSSDPQYTQLLLGMGLPAFSVVPRAIPEIKKVVRAESFAHAQEVAKAALAMKSAAEIDRYLAVELRKLVPDLL